MSDRKSTTCSICDKPVQAKGWCDMHYRRYRKHGDPLGPQRTLTHLPEKPGVTFALLPSSERYAAGDDGTVWSSLGKGHSGQPTEGAREWCQLKSWPNTRGYLQVYVLRETYTVHRVVLEAFRGTRPTGMECRHLNGNKQDNRLCNLAWGTRSENAIDNLRQGKGKCRLSADKVRAIRARFSIGEKQRDLAGSFGVSVSQIAKVVQVRQWKHVE